jgi:hypothetical protein
LPNFFCVKEDMPEISAPTSAYTRHFSVTAVILFVKIGSQYACGSARDIAGLRLMTLHCGDYFLFGMGADCKAILLLTPCEARAIL